jgi:rod shape-determining protein MreC
MNTSPSRVWQLVVLFLVVGGVIAIALSGYLTPVLNTALNPFVSVQSWISSRYMAIYEFLTVPRDVASLRERNAELEDQVSNLQAQIVELNQQLADTQILYALLNFARDNPENEYVASTVIGRDPSAFLHYVIINQGSDDGIRHGMPVVTEQGLVGRIDAVTATAARVQLITDPGSSINVHIQSSNTDIELSGSLTGDVSLNLVPQDLSLAMGDLVLTSGLGGTYPADIVVGQVVGVRKRETDLFQTASVQPVVDFSALKAVLVITNFHPTDVTPLMATQEP